MKGVYAIGDVTDLGEMLAHVASFQGEMVAEIIAGKNVYTTQLLYLQSSLPSQKLFLLDYLLMRQKKQDILLSPVNSLLQQMVDL